MTVTAHDGGRGPAHDTYAAGITWDLTKTAEPASLDIWKGDAGKVHYTGLSQSGSFAYDYQVTGDHTDTVQVLSADQNPALAQASATVKVNVWSLDIAKAVTSTRGRLPGWTARRAGPAVLASRPRVPQAPDIAEFLFDQRLYES